MKDENVQQPQTIIHGIEKVVVHPLVLLSVVDHFSRNQSLSRSVGVLLGNTYKGVLNVANSFAFPFDEDPKDPKVWFLDHDYLESMYTMFKKVNAKEKIVGWYHTGPKLRKNDILINELMRKYNPNSVLIVIDVGESKESRGDADGLPTDAYIMVEEVHDDGTPTSKTFEHIPSEIGAEEAEEVGVEHLLRDIKVGSYGTLAQRITRQLTGLRGLFEKLRDIDLYLEQVNKGELPINHAIVYELQDILNLLPDVNFQEFIKAFEVKTNDQLAVVYISSVIRTIIGLHNLVSNKLQNKKLEEAKNDEKKKENKESEKKDENEKKDEKPEAKPSSK